MGVAVSQESQMGSQLTHPPCYIAVLLPGKWPMAYVALVCAPGTGAPVSGRLRTIQLRVVKITRN